MRMNSEEQRAEQEGWWTRQQRGRKDGTIESTIERTVLYSPHYNSMLCYGRPLLTGSDFGQFSSVVFFFCTIYHYSREVYYSLWALSIVFYGFWWSDDWTTSPGTFWKLGTTTFYLPLLIFYLVQRRSYADSAISVILVISFRNFWYQSECARI
jgi:hypothetical protein